MLKIRREENIGLISGAEMYQLMVDQLTSYEMLLELKQILSGDDVFHL